MLQNKKQKTVLKRPICKLAHKQISPFLNSGFTLIELVVSIALSTIVVSLGLLLMQQQFGRSRDFATRENLADAVEVSLANESRREFSPTFLQNIEIVKQDEKDHLRVLTTRPDLLARVISREVAGNSVLIETCILRRSRTAYREFSHWVVLSLDGHTFATGEPIFRNGSGCSEVHLSVLLEVSSADLYPAQAITLRSEEILIHAITFFPVKDSAEFFVDNSQVFRRRSLVKQSNQPLAREVLSVSYLESSKFTTVVSIETTNQHGSQAILRYLSHSNYQPERFLEYVF